MWASGALQGTDEEVSSMWVCERVQGGGLMVGRMVQFEAR